MWHLDGNPVPKDPISGWLIVGDVLYPPNWPMEDLGLVWVAPEEPLPTLQELLRSVDTVRDTRIDAGFFWNGNRYQSRPSDRENILGAATLAMAYLSAGGPDNLRWSNPDQDFVWIAESNVLVPLTPTQVVSLFQAGVAYKTSLTFYARGLKDALEAAEDPNSIDIYAGWPE